MVSPPSLGLDSSETKALRTAKLTPRLMPIVPQQTRSNPSFNKVSIATRPGGIMPL